MKSKATPRFWKLYGRLPLQVQKRARKAYQTWQTNPSAHGLRFKRVSEQEPIYSIRVGDDHRVLGLLEEDIMGWFWIGDHDEYLRLLR